MICDCKLETLGIVELVEQKGGPYCVNPTWMHQKKVGASTFLEDERFWCCVHLLPLLRSPILAMPERWVRMSVHQLPSSLHSPTIPSSVSDNPSLPHCWGANTQLGASPSQCCHSAHKLSQPTPQHHIQFCQAKHWSH